ncbi:hypothetical protein C5167_026432 [Papaver somniferum]|nr:hypothetical protein C5167_026432 [Papaver somniferum]
MVRRLFPSENMKKSSMVARKLLDLQFKKTSVTQYLVIGSVLRNLKNKADAPAPQNDENYGILIDEIINSNIEQCVRDGTLEIFFRWDD